MPFSPSEFAGELRRLRKGRGINTAKLGEKMGPALTVLFDIDPSDTNASIRDKAIGRLRVLVETLPANLRRPVTVALALDADAGQPFLRDRVQALADREKRHPRTVLRRIDDGFDLLGESAAARSAEPTARREGEGWRVERFEAILRMDKQTPECFERRRIVAERDGLDEIRASMTVPPDDRNAGADPDLVTEVYHGAVLVDRKRLSGSRFAFTLRLPRTLDRGAEHEYGLMVRIPPPQLMRSHYVFFPERECAEFELCVRFDPGRLPALIWRVNEVFHREIDDPRSTGDVLPVDRAGEVRVSFSHLLPGRGYGVQWRDSR